MLNLFKAMNAKLQLREFDPMTVQRIKEGAYLVKMISETQVAARKCEFFASNAVDQEIKNAFEDEAKILKQGARTLQQYYESITTE
ncbi:hypothetical protein [Desulfallas thermosapovorans]|uniref:Uncharacterized protein n=1 Tax=Desulfallas thermosapovorans DSM 6562 TaxID=1121431 RepID=A0A5S4ZPL0_9FIRM|nr:hypothetical protein [Desulfallas thermosapovorans]TYO94500.1 hypothetical protein LX24_02334 [Desulfallas thermosapovorans DSM 6562]